MASPEGEGEAVQFVALVAPLVVADKQEIAFAEAYKDAPEVVPQMVPGALELAEHYAEWDVAKYVSLIPVGHFAAPLVARNVPVVLELGSFVVGAFLVHKVHTVAGLLEIFVKVAAEEFVLLQNPEIVLAAGVSVQLKDPETVPTAETFDSCIAVDTVKHQQRVHAVGLAELMTEMLAPH